MAETAERLQFGPPPAATEPHLRLYEPEDEPDQPLLISADTIPALRARRFQARQEAFQMRQQNHAYLIDGEFGKVQLPVDALGTARRVNQTPRELVPGVENPLYAERFEALALDCLRLRAEAIRKNTYEVYQPLLRKFNPATGEYYTHGIAMKTDMVAKGLSPLLAPTSENGRRRDNEYVEEDTYAAIPETATQMLGRLAIGRQVSTLTFSECSDEAIADYKSGKAGNYGGEVPEIEKFVIRGVRFLPNRDRLDESVAASGLFITHEVIVGVLKDISALPPDQYPDKTELHGMQFLSLAGLRPLDFMKLLDAKASEMTGKDIFMGEEISTSVAKDYEAVTAEAEAREAVSWEESHKLAQYVLQLEENKVDSWVALKLVEEHVRQRLFNHVIHNPDEAEIIFDKKTADGLRKVQKLRDSGLHTEANQLLELVETEAPMITFCMPGACGLRAATKSEAVRARELGLCGDEIIHDEERPCPGCGAMEVYYDGNGSKACTACGNRELK